MTQVEAVEVTIGALEAKLQPEHRALFDAARGLAETVDANPANAALWRQYRESITALLEAVPEAKDDDGQAALLELVRPPVRNPKNTKAKNTRTRAGNRGGNPGHPPDAVATPGRRRRAGAAS